MKAPDILAKAEGHMRDRAATYDKPEGERSMARAVAAFNAIHGTSLTVAQGWHFMAVLKQVRLFTRPGYDADSLEDLVAYCALLGEEMSEEADDPTPVAPSRPWREGDYVTFTHCGDTLWGHVAGVTSTGMLRVVSGSKGYILRPEKFDVTLAEVPYVDPYDQPARG